MTVLSIDPGRSEKPTIGYCVFTDKGEEIERGELDWRGLVATYGYDPETMTLFFRGYPVYRVVCEDFVNDPRVKRGGQRNGASEVIGAIEFVADSASVSFVRRDRSTLHAAMKHAGYTQTKAHLPHQDSAYVHGYSDFVMRGILPVVGIADTM